MYVGLITRFELVSSSLLTTEKVGLIFISAWACDFSCLAHLAAFIRMIGISLRRHNFIPTSRYKEI